MGSPAYAIAILDDEEGFRRALSRLLRAHDHHVSAYESGEALLRDLEFRRFDCLLLDLHMPGVSGFDVLAALGCDPASPPAIAITGHDDPDFARRALALGAFACQRKPVGAATLLESIARACSGLRPPSLAP
ncbi:MAG: response regulator [Burkholderiales bacterium]|nr:response regulator [Burkholderiales bacterium]